MTVGRAVTGTEGLGGVRQAMKGKAGTGDERQGRPGWVRRVVDWHGSERQAWIGKLLRGPFWICVAGSDRLSTAWNGWSCFGKERQAGIGEARFVIAGKGRRQKGQVDD